MGSKNAAKMARRRAKRKEERSSLRPDVENAEMTQHSKIDEHEKYQIVESGSDAADTVQIEYVVESPLVEDAADPLTAAFAKVFQKFTPTLRSESNENELDIDEDLEGAGKYENREGSGEEDGEDNGDEEIDVSQLSKRKLKQLTRMSVAELKQRVSHPEVVELEDCNSPDPRLLVHLKAYRNTVSVPVHWKQKRKYLQGKRGYAKPPFALPPHIAATGIAEMRHAQLAADEEKRANARQRERVQPKMGKLDIDYQRLHDAFFKTVYKPKLTGPGELYYEGKEFDVAVKRRTPGQLSSSLREALLLPVHFPPPWLINMQRFGPPPSYRFLRVPGLNAPLPAGAAYGYGEGAWGKPPVDHFGQPLYGNPFDPPEAPVDSRRMAETFDRWGELEDIDAMQSSSSDGGGDDDKDVEIEVDDDDEMPTSKYHEMSGDTPLTVASGLQSYMTSSSTTPALLDLRKDGTVSTPHLYTVVQQQQQQHKINETAIESTTSAVGTSLLMGTSHSYMIPSGRSKVVQRQLEANRDGVQVALAPEELEQLDEQMIQRRYEVHRRAQLEQPDHNGDDDDDGVGGKRRRKPQSGSALKKKFKF